MEAGLVRNSDPGASRVEPKNGFSPVATFTAIGAALVVIGAIAAARYAPVLKSLAVGSKIGIIGGGGVIGAVAGGAFGWIVSGGNTEIKKSTVASDAQHSAKKGLECTNEGAFQERIDCLQQQGFKVNEAQMVLLAVLYMDDNQRNRER